MITMVGIRYRNYAYYTLYRSCLLIDGVVIVRLPNILDDFEGNHANISVAIRSGSTVVQWSLKTQEKTTPLIYLLLSVG